jgi:hypothetical protein
MELFQRNGGLALHRIQFGRREENALHGIAPLSRPTKEVKRINIVRRREALMSRRSNLDQPHAMMQRKPAAALDASAGVPFYIFFRRKRC